MKYRISSQYVPRMKDMFAALLYYRIIIAEKTHIILITLSVIVFLTMTIRLCIKLVNINALLLATCSEMDLVFVRRSK